MRAIQSFRVLRRHLNRKNVGFTLIELLIVIAIIGILATLIIISLQGASAKGRDAKRKTNARNIASALSQYHQDNSLAYPVQNVAGGVDVTTAALENALSPTYLPSVGVFTHDKNAKYISDNGGLSYAQAWELESITEPAVTTGTGVYATNSLNLAGVVSIPSAKGNALAFNGSTQYLTTATNNAAMNQTGALTIAAWVNFSAALGQKTILSHFTNTAASSAYEFSINGTSLRFDAGQSLSLTSAQSSGTVAADSAWHFVAVTRNGATVTFYVDGVAQGNSSNTVTAVALNNVATGIDIARRTGATNYFNGQIDGVRVYSSALSALTISSLYNGGSGAYGDATEPNLVMAWRFDDASATTTDYKSSIALTLTGLPLPTVVTGKLPLGLTGIGSSLTGKAFVTYGPQ